MKNKVNGSPQQQNVSLKMEQVTAALSAAADILAGAQASRVLEYANDGRLGAARMIIAGLVSGDLVIVPKSAIQQQPKVEPKPARSRRAKR
jgi:hypothetical protein